MEVLVIILLICLAVAIYTIWLLKEFVTEEDDEYIPGMP